MAELGGAIDLTLAEMGGTSAVVDLPAALVVDPKALMTRLELRSRVRKEIGTAALIPLDALGKTFVWDVEVDHYVMSDLPGAPANGVRFVLYAVDPITHDVVEPLVETGYADLTRTSTATTVTARVEVYSAGIAPVKVLDYSVTVQGPAVAPTFLVDGFARNGTDSLAFELSSTLAFVAETIELDWNAEHAARGVGAHVLTTLTTGGATPNALINGLIAGPNGSVRIEGQVFDATGGTISVKVNGELFATITVEQAEDETPVILNAAGDPPTEAEAEMLRMIFHWFARAFVVFASLLAPVGTLLDIAF
jgi:hypothetical protein